MSTNDAGALQPCPTDDCADYDDLEDLDERDVRALQERMGVLPAEGDDLHTVVGENQNGEYTVDARRGRCTCPDHEYRDVRCKHIRRVRFATGERAIPAGVDRDAVDELLGAHLDTEPRFAATDGGHRRDPPRRDVAAEREAVATDGGSVVEPAAEAATDVDDGPTYTYHTEPAPDGARYVRCETCGAECVPADPDRLAHRQGCPEGRR